MGDAAPYRNALEQLYGSDTLDRAEGLLSGQERFFGTQAPGMGLDGCDMHQRLLKAYNKVHSR